MKKSINLSLLVGLLMAGNLEAEEKVLNVYNWADYIGPDTMAAFEAEFGIKVNYDLYDSTTIVEAKLMAGQTGYDVVLQALNYSARMMPLGMRC